MALLLESIPQVLFKEEFHFLKGQLGFRRVGKLVLENVRHAFIKVQPDTHTSSVHRLVKPHKVAQKKLPRAALDQSRRKAFRKVAIHRRNIRMLLLLQVRIGRSGWAQCLVI